MGIKLKGLGGIYFKGKQLKVKRWGAEKTSKE